MVRMFSFSAPQQTWELLMILCPLGCLAYPYWEKVMGYFPSWATDPMPKNVEDYARHTLKTHVYSINFTKTARARQIHEHFMSICIT